MKSQCLIIPKLPSDSDGVGFGSRCNECIVAHSFYGTKKNHFKFIWFKHKCFPASKLPSVTELHGMKSI